MFLNLIPQTPKPTHCILQKKKKKSFVLTMDTTIQDKEKRQTLLNVWILYKEKKYPRNKFITASHWEIMYNWFIWKLKKYIMPCILQALDCLRIPTIAVHISCAHEKLHFKLVCKVLLPGLNYFIEWDIIPWFLLLPTPKISHLLFFKCKQERSILFI